MMGWTTADMPSQSGRLAVITGATGGLGFETARALAGAGAEIVLTGRNAAKGAEALARLRAEHLGAAARFALLDVASLGSVEAFAGNLQAEGRGVDLLINNAGVMALPKRQLSADGFELQFATNYLGHFALTARLLPLLRQATGARVVNLASLAAHHGRIDLADLQAEQSYAPFRVYGMTKLALLVFALELQRRSAAAGWGVSGIAAHPGMAATDIMRNGPASSGVAAVVWRWVRPLILPLNATATEGAVPVLFAATSPQAQGGGYYGPSRSFETKGPVAPAKLPERALDAAIAAGLWQASERLAGVSFA
jgi:NAD(P)-dependent dehydrogenase (short-subunit alcohol dehydrogenase family)